MSALNGPFLVARMLQMLPGVTTVTLASRGAGESGFTAYSWKAWRKPNQQLEHLASGAIVSKRTVDLQLFRVAQTVMPKEIDQVYYPAKLGVYDIKTLHEKVVGYVWDLECELTETLTAVTIDTTSLPDGTSGVAYSQTISASGGQTPYAFSISSGSLPTGWSLNASTGVLSGTTNVAGDYTFTVQVTDFYLQTTTQSYTVTVS